MTLLRKHATVLLITCALPTLACVNCIQDILELQKCKKGFDDVISLENTPGACIDQCKARENCSSISYHVYAHMCFLHGTEALENSDGNCNNFGYSEKASWQEQTLSCDSPYCDQNRATCTDGKCRYKDCSIPEQSAGNLQLLGNLRSVGTKIAYKCSRNYELHGTKSMSCLQDGTWSHPFPSCHPPETALLATTTTEGQAAKIEAGTTTNVETTTTTETTKRTTADQSAATTTVTRTAEQTTTTALDAATTTTNIAEESSITITSTAEQTKTPTSADPATTTIPTMTEPTTTTTVSKTTAAESTTKTTSETIAATTTAATTTFNQTRSAPLPVATTAEPEPTTSTPERTTTFTSEPTTSIASEQATKTSTTTTYEQTTRATGFTCLSGWKLYQESCYLATSTATVFNDTVCPASSSLVVPNTVDENDFIKSIFEGVLYSYWIGRELIADTWVVAGSTSVLDYNDWHDGLVPTHPSQTCAIFLNSKEYKWNARSCSVAFRAVCEMPATVG